MLISNRKLHIGFRFVPIRSGGMTLKSEMAIIMHYATKFVSFGGQLRQNGWR